MGNKYRSNVAAIIINNQGEIFLGERVDAPGSWQIPQGGIKTKKDEKPKQALWRELGEELGLKKPRNHMRIIGKYPGWLQYDFPQWLRDRGGKFAKYKGQKQKYFLLIFEGKEHKITLEQDGVREFRDYQWARPGEITKTVADFKRAVTDQALEYFQKSYGEYF